MNKRSNMPVLVSWRVLSKEEAPFTELSVSCPPTVTPRRPRTNEAPARSNAALRDKSDEAPVCEAAHPDAVNSPLISITSMTSIHCGGVSRSHHPEMGTNIRQRAIDLTMRTVYASTNTLLNILMVLVVTSGHAVAAETTGKMWAKDYTLEFRMGDGDSRTSARQAAIEEVRKQASAEAGTYIQTTTSLSAQGILDETIQMIGASMVHIADVKDQIVLSPEGTPLLKLSAKVSVDEEELLKRVVAIQADQAKAAVIKTLQGENARLQKDLETIREQIKAAKDTGTTSTLLQKQNDTVVRLEANQNSVVQVFTRGTIITMAQKKNDEFDSIKERLERDFYEPILNAKITAEIEEVLPEGDNYIVALRVGWQYKTKIGQYLDKGHNRDTSGGFGRRGTLTGTEHRRDHQKSLIQQKTFDYLMDNPVSLQVSVAGVTLSFPVAFLGTGFGLTCGRSGRPSGPGTDPYSTFCTVEVDPSIKSDSNIPDHGGNPVHIKISKSQAEQATRVEARMVRARR